MQKIHDYEVRFSLLTFSVWVGGNFYILSPLFEIIGADVLMISCKK